MRGVADERCPEDPVRAKRLASVIGAYAALFVAIILLALVMPTSSKSSKSRSSSRSSVDISDLARCYKRNGVVGNMRGCRGSENSMECARRHCGTWNKEAHNKALYD